MRTVILQLTVVVALYACASAPVVAAETDGEGARLTDRLIGDTIYHAVVDLADSTITVCYGPFVLVVCRFAQRGAEAGVLTAFGESHRGCGVGWHTVTGRRVWSGREAVPQRVVRVVTRTVTAEPELVARVMPDRFQVDLAGGLSFRIMTARGVNERHTFGEKWRRWIAGLCPESAGRLLTMIVAPEDAQTLYYALEPGTPVIIRSDR